MFILYVFYLDDVVKGIQDIEINIVQVNKKCYTEKIKNLQLKSVIYLVSVVIFICIGTSRVQRWPVRVHFGNTKFHV